MDSPLLSVIIPVYNVKEYIHDCVKSVLGQHFDDMEIILVDDGSSDGSEAVCDEYKKSYPEIISVIHKPNGGASSARNAGLKMAKGKYVYFLDSDDYPEEGAFSEVVSCLEDTGADMCVFEAKTVDEDSGIIKEGNYSYSAQYPVSDGLMMMKEMYEKNEFHFVIWMMMYRRDFLTENGILCKEGVMYEDMLYVLEVFALSKKVVHIHRPLYYRRFRENSVMTSKIKAKNFFSSAEISKSIAEFATDAGIATLSFIQKYIVRVCLNTVNYYSDLNKTEKGKCAKAYRDYSAFLSREDYFGSKELRMRVKGKAFWLAYKAAEKAGVTK